MIILGEKLNSSIPSALAAINSEDDSALIALCVRQEECGADYLDINTAIADDELTAMQHIVNLALDNTDCGIMLDSPNPEIISEVIKTVKNRNVIINSITMDERHELIKTAKEYNAGIVALPMTEDGIPDNAEERFHNAEKLINLLNENGIENDKIFIDVIIESLAVNSEAAKTAIETTRLIRNRFEDVHITGGLSNISFGLPKRININTVMIPALMCAGLDSAIIDITSDKIRNTVISSSALCGEDEFCMNYIENFRG